MIKWNLRLLDFFFMMQSYGQKGKRGTAPKLSDLP